MRKSSATQYMGDVAQEPTVYVVANQSDAVFYLDGSDRKFHFIDRLSNRKAHLTEIDLVSDRPGRGISSAGSGVFHHSLGRGFTHHEQAAKDFARKIADQLGVARRNKQFHNLVLVAEPHFLGLLREALDSETRAVIKHEINREYAQGSDSEIRSAIMKAIEAKH